MDRTVTRITTILVIMLVVVGVTRSQMRSNKLGVGFGGAYILSQTDRDPRSSFGGSMDVTYSMIEYLSLRGTFGVGHLRTKDATGNYLTLLMNANLGLAFDMAPSSSLNPFLFVGVSGLYADPRYGTGAAILGTDGKRSLLVSGSAAAGLDIFFSEFFSMTVAGEWYVPVSDRIDGLTLGTKKDMFERVTVGFRYYFFDQTFITRMLEALKERYEK